MSSMIASIWSSIQNWVITWNDTTFAIVITFLGVCGLYAVLGFFKKSYNTDKKIKWFKVVLCVLVFGLIALLCSAKWT